MVLLTFLAAAATATLIGLVTLWSTAADRPPVPASAAFAAPNVSFPHATVVTTQNPCPTLSPDDQQDIAPEPTTSCGNIEVRVGSKTELVQVPPEILRSGLRRGDRVQLVRSPQVEGQPALYGYFGTDRHVPLIWFAAAFVVIVVAVARLRGLLAVLTLGFGSLVIVKFMLPALLAGESGVWVALVGASSIMFVVLYVTHGLSLRTSSALAGTLAGVLVMALVGHYGVHATRLTGIADEGGTMLATFVSDLNFPGLLTCGLILAGLGVLNDVTITQASAVWELRSAAPRLPRREIFRGAMRIGRDHIASTIYTVVFAYAGASIVVLLLVDIYDRPLLDLLSSEAIAEEIVRILASAIGLVLAVPFTTAIAATVASPASRDIGR